MSISRCAITCMLTMVLLLAGTGQAFGTMGEFRQELGARGSAAGQLDQPTGLAVAPNGDLYVVDKNNDRIQYFSATGSYEGQWGGSGAAPGQLYRPHGIAIAPNGDVYVADTFNHRIQHFGPDGTPKGGWGSEGTGNGQFKYPEGVAIAPNGDVYIADTGNHRMQWFAPGGSFKGTAGVWGEGNSQFKNPSGLAFSPGGVLYVADSANHRVQYFSAEGTYLGRWGTLGSMDGRLYYPEALAVSPNGGVYVADTMNHRVQCFGPAGAFRGVWGSNGGDPGRLYYPGGIAIGKDGDAWVADTLNYRLQKFGGMNTAGLNHDAGGVTFTRWITGYNAAYEGGGYVYSRTAGEALETRFYGSRITWNGPMQPGYGTAEVYIDGVYQGTFDCYAPAETKTTKAAIWTSRILPEGPHTIRIRATGFRNTLSTGSVVVVDSFSVEGMVPAGVAGRRDETTGSFAGQWIKGTNSAYIGRGYHYSRSQRAAFSMTFTGSRVAWIGPRTGAYGRAEVYVDGNYMGTVSQHGPMAWRARVWESNPLAPGVHTLVIKPTGTKDAKSTGTNIVIDAIDVVP